MRILAVIHLAWSLVLLLIAAWLAAAAFRILPHLSSGARWADLPTVLMMAAVQAGPLIALGLWMAILGRWTWRGHPKIRAMLLVTHGFLLVVGLGVIVIGVLALGAAQRSAARGGGLMGPLGAIPLATGICISTMAIVAISMALFALPRPRASGPGR